MSHAIPVGPLVWLSLAFALKHVIADFVLQSNAIAVGKDAATGWQLPLARHVAGHVILTLAIALIAAPGLWWLALVDLVVHAGIDRGKSIARRVFNAEPKDAVFWWLIGIDQTLHHLTHLSFAITLAA